MSSARGLLVLVQSPMECASLSQEEQDGSPSVTCSNGTGSCTGQDPPAALLSLWHQRQNNAPLQVICLVHTSSGSACFILIFPGLDYCKHHLATNKIFWRGLLCLLKQYEAEDKGC